MFRMLSCFDVKPRVSETDYNALMQDLAKHLTELDPIEGIGVFGKRETDTSLDADEERHQQYLLMISVRDKVQSDRAIDYIESLQEPGTSLHINMFKKITNPMFVCWEDLILD